MPKAYRGMREDDGTGQPALLVPPNAPPLALAARIRLTHAGSVGDGNFDVTADAAGVVYPGTGGMSVSPSWGDLPSFLIPFRLRGALPLRNFKKAAGGNSVRIWSRVVSSFPADVAPPVPFAVGLVLRVNRPGHAMVEPAGPTAHDRYQAALAATQSSWVIDEPPSATDGRPLP